MCHLQWVQTILVKPPARQRPLARGFFSSKNPLTPLPAVLLRMVNDYGEEINPGSPAAFCPAQLLL
jgi:hypothetical protein